MAFEWDIRVYYEDTDAGGVVYHAQYLKFLERARTEFLRSLGYEQDALRDDLQLVFVVKSLVIDYLKPAYFNDVLEIQSNIIAVRKASVDFMQKIIRNGESLVTAELTVVCITAGLFKPTAIPSHLLADLHNAE